MRSEAAIKADRVIVRCLIEHATPCTALVCQLLCRFSALRYWTGQRFTPRRARSHWTELNKERARRLIAAGLMTDAGRAVLPDLDVASFRIADDILAALQADPEVWGHFQRFPGAYQRIRIGYIEEMRRQPDIFHQRLEHFLRKTRQGTMFGTLE